MVSHVWRKERYGHPRNRSRHRLFNPSPPHGCIKPCLEIECYVRQYQDAAKHCWRRQRRQDIAHDKGSVPPFLNPPFDDFRSLHQFPGSSSPEIIDTIARVAGGFEVLSD